MPSFLFTDVEGSTQLLRDLESEWATIIERQRSIIVGASAACGGSLMSTAGDGTFCAFPDDDGSAAVHAALAAQVMLAEEPWPAGADVRVRMGVHAGAAVCVGGDWVGLAVHQAARLSAVGHGGQIIVIADLCPTSLDRVALGEHLVKDFDGVVELVQLTAPGRRTNFPPLRTLSRSRHNLPLRRTTFVGREREQGLVDKLLDETRLVTIVGPGGVGKTRLAVETAGERLGRHASGTFLVELAPVVACGVAGAIAAAVTEPGHRRGGASLAELLADRALLLVLDNCEHLLDDVAAVMDEVLDHCADIHVIATSREALGLAGEAICRLEPLAGPSVDADHVAEIVDVMEHPATRLLVDRAHLVRPDLSLDADAAAIVVQLCRRLDGLPLAIELAAARLSSHTLAELEAALADRFDVLDGARRGGSAHQRTLDDLVGWSHDLLEDDERMVLRRLSVFAGAAAADAAQAVCIRSDDDGAEGAGGWRVLDRLVDRSLLQADTADGNIRYRLLETVRSHARRRLIDAGEEDGTVADHAAWFEHLVEAEIRRFVGPEQADAMRILSLELDEIRRAMRTMIDNGSDVQACRTAGNLRSYWVSTGQLEEGRRWLAQALALPHDAPTRQRARALQAAGWLALEDDDTDDVEPLLRDCVAVSEATGDERCRAQALDGLARLAMARGDLGRAEALLEQSLEVRRELGIEVELSAALSNLAGVVAQHDVERAARLVEEGLVIDRDSLSPTAIAISLRNLGLLRWGAESVDAARAAWTEARDLARTAGDRRLEVMFAQDLARCAEADDDLAGAADLLDDALVAIAAVEGARKRRPPIHLERARIARRLDDLAAARDHAQQAHELAIEVGDGPLADKAALELQALDAGLP